MADQTLCRFISAAAPLQIGMLLPASAGTALTDMALGRMRDVSAETMRAAHAARTRFAVA